MPFMLDPMLVRQWIAACSQAQALRSVAVAAKSRRRMPDGEQHTVATLAVCLHGVVRVQLADGNRDLGVGQALLIPPGIPHAHAPLRNGSACLGMGFMLDVADIDIAVPGANWLLTIPEHPARSLVERASVAAAAERLRLVRLALAELSLASAKPLAPMPEPTRRMWMYLRRERLSPIRAGDVLRASGLAPTRAKQLFKAWFGVTPLRLLRRHRLELASHLLAQGASVAAAAAASGFRSRRHLTASCRAVHGRPPSRLDARHLRSPSDGACQPPREADMPSP